MAPNYEMLTATAHIERWSGRHEAIGFVNHQSECELRHNHIEATRDNYFLCFLYNLLDSMS